MGTRTAGGNGTNGGQVGATKPVPLPRNAQITVIPSSVQLRLKVSYLRTTARKAVIVSWPSGKHRPNPDSLTKAEWSRLTNLLLKLCDSAF